MKKTMQLKRSGKGFTLLEVIITIVIAGILASFLITFMQSVPKSADPVIQTQNFAAALAIMEKTTADYESYLRTISPGPANPAWSTIGSGGYVNDTVNSTTIRIGNISFTLREVTVTAGNQTLVSYFIE